MFICSHLMSAGIEFKGAAFQGEYFGHFSASSSTLDGIIVHYWSGNVMMCTSKKIVLEQLAVYLKNNVKRPIGAILGMFTQVDQVMSNLNLYDVGFKVDRTEGLYAIELASLDGIATNMPDNFHVCNAREISKDIVIEWVQAYNIEALGGSLHDEGFEQQVLQTADLLIQRGDCWVLLMDSKPISMTAFNARVDDAVQIGPVLTPPELRGRGFARLLLLYMLTAERKKATKEAVLFAENFDEIKVYQSIVFHKIGDYCIALLKKSIGPL